MVHSVYILNDNCREKTMLFICQILKARTLNCFLLLFETTFWNIIYHKYILSFFFNKPTV